MIKLKQTASTQQLEVTLSGDVTANDYQSVLAPGIAAALEENDCVRLLVTVEDDVSYDFGAAWSDLKLGLSHWRGFDRVAVVSNLDWVSNSIAVVAPFAPCPVQKFKLAEVEDARRWLRESLGALHLQDLGEHLIHIQLMGKLDPENYESRLEDINELLKGADGCKLLLDLREFEGWEGLSALSAHLHFALGHAPNFEKIAIVGNHAWQRMAERVGKRILRKEVKFFEQDHFDDARNWLLAA